MNRHSHNEYGGDSNDEDEEIKIAQPYAPSVKISTNHSAYPQPNSQNNNNQIQMNMPILSRPIRLHSGLVPVDQMENNQSDDYNETESEYEDEMVNLDDLEVMLDNEGYSIKDKETIFSVVSTPFENKSYKQLISILCNDSGLHRIIIHNPNLLQAFNQEAIELPVGFMINLLTAGEEDGRFKAYQEEFSCQVDFDSKNDYSHITDSLVMKDEELESFNQKISEAEIEIERLKKENSLLEIQYKVRIDKYIKE